MVVEGGEGERRSLQQVPGRVEEGKRKEVDLLEDNSVAEHTTVNS